MVTYCLVFISLNTARHCTFNDRVIKHGYKLSDPLCTGVLSCYNGQLHMEYCPKIPQKPKDCARPKLKTISVPGKCCKKLWVCSGSWKLSRYLTDITNIHL